MSKLTWGIQPQGASPYPTDGKETPEITAMQAKSLLALLSQNNVFIPPVEFSSVASGLQSVTRVCGKLTRIVNAATTSVVLVNAIRQNTPGFALMVALGVVNQTAIDNGINPNDVVSSAVAKANELINTPIKFLENAFRARSYAQASFTGSGISEVFGALRSVSQLLQACKTLSDLLSGGVSARLGPNADNTANGARLRAAGITVSGDQIRLGIATVSIAMRRIGTLWDVNDPDTVGTPIGMILGLNRLGLIDKLGDFRSVLEQNGIFVDDEFDTRTDSKYSALEALRTINGNYLKFLVRTTNCFPFAPNRVQTAADLCQGDILIGQEALDNIPYGDLENFGKSIASFGIKNKVTWELVADALDQLELPDIGLIDKPNYSNDMNVLSGYLGTGSGLFGDSTLYDFLGTAAGKAHTDAYTRLSAANDALERTAEGQALKVALEYYDLHSDPADPDNNLAETNLIAALEAVKGSSDPEVQAAAAEADKSILESALQLVGEITSALAIGYGLYTSVLGIIAVATKIGTSIQAQAAGLGANAPAQVATTAELNAGLTFAAAFPEGFFTAAFKGALRMVRQVFDAVGDATGITDLLLECCNPNTTGGQAMKALIAESYNAKTLGAIGMSIPSVNIEDEAAKKRARFGFGLTIEQQTIITSYGRSRGLSANEIEDLFFINAYYGYQRHFFENTAGFFERSRFARQQVGNA
jgi:hypothetical protein